MKQESLVPFVGDYLPQFGSVTIPGGGAAELLIGSNANRVAISFYVDSSGFSSAVVGIDPNLTTTRGWQLSTNVTPKIFTWDEMGSCVCQPWYGNSTGGYTFQWVEILFIPVEVSSVH